LALSLKFMQGLLIYHPVWRESEFPAARSTRPPSGMRATPGVQSSSTAAAWGENGPLQRMTQQKKRKKELPQGSFKIHHQKTERNLCRRRAGQLRQTPFTVFEQSVDRLEIATQKTQLLSFGPANLLASRLFVLGEGDKTPARFDAIRPGTRYFSDQRCVQFVDNRFGFLSCLVEQTDVGWVANVGGSARSVSPDPSGR